MEIVVRIRNVYGNEHVYPVCDKAMLLARLAGQTTLTNCIGLIKALGYTIKVEQVSL